MQTQNQEIQQQKKGKISEVRNAIRNAMPSITLIAICILYASKGLFDLQAKSKSIVEILGDIGIGGFVGLSIYTCLRAMGLKRGRNSDKFNASLLLYGEAKEKTKEYRYMLPSFCVMKNEQELEEYKREVIENEGLNYNFWKKGLYAKENYEKLNLDERQISIIESIDKLKIERLKPNELLSDLPTNNSLKKYGRFGRSEDDYKKSGLLIDAICMVVFAISFGYFVLLPILNKESLANVLFNCFQLAMWLSFGINKYMNAVDFMENEYRQTHIIQKTEYLNEFISIMSADNNSLNKYDTVQLIINKLEENKEVESNVNEQTTI